MSRLWTRGGEILVNKKPIWFKGGQDEDFSINNFIYIFFCRIKNTPAMLSKKLYMKRMQKSIDKNKENLKNMDETQQAATKLIALIVVWILEMLFSIFYIVLGTKLGTTYMLILSALQVFTCVYTTIKQVNMSAFSQNIEDFKFYRWYFLFNVILDYMYYPVAIYMLLR